MSATPKKSQEVLDEERAIQELSIGHQCLIELRYLLKRENWSNDSRKNRINTLSGRALHGLQAGLSFITSACSSRVFGAETSDDPVPSADPIDPTLSAEFSKKRTKSLPTGDDTKSKLSDKRAMTSASLDINSSEKKRRRSSNLDSWTKTTDPHDDRHLWAKYGQKQIKDSRHPRSYYKCKHIDCCAMKKVQKCDTSDTTMYYVAYTGKHTCNIAPPPPQIQRTDPSENLWVNELMEILQSPENNNHTTNAPPLPERTVTPAFNFLSVSGSCPSKNLDEDCLLGELNSHPSLSSGPSASFHHDGLLGEFNSYPSFSDWSSST